MKEVVAVAHGPQVVEQVLLLLPQHTVHSTAHTAVADSPATP